MTPSFSDFELSPPILHALSKMGFKEPLAIQAKTIPLIKEGRDLIALAQTGSGKTAACAIPICDKVDTDRIDIQALIVVPTRELAMQYATEVQKIGQDKGIKAFALCGGEDAAMQMNKLKNGVQLLIATPGRLIDFIYSRSIDLSHVQTLVLDEADEMLSMGFYDDLEFIIQCLVQEHQTLLFSATMPATIRTIAKQHMRDPLELTLLDQQASPLSIEHRFLYCQHSQRDQALLHVMQELQPKQGIIFCRSRHECESVCRTLKKSFSTVDFLHAGLTQEMRSTITNKFRSGRIQFLVATDVAARGLDFAGVTHVFLYHLPDDADTYVHRTGRTGRRDRIGTAVSLVTHRELSSLALILKRIDRAPIWIGEPPPLNANTPSSPQRRRPPYRR
jgi:ATP-dependent RNA helicase DeaD